MIMLVELAGKFRGGPRGSGYGFSSTGTLVQVSVQLRTLFLQVSVHLHGSFSQSKARR